MRKENNKKITDYLTEREINILRKFSDLQLNILNSDDVYKVELISFEHDGVNIVNPFVDETDTYNVDPIKYYGEDFLNSDFMKMFE